MSRNYQRSRNLDKLSTSNAKHVKKIMQHVPSSYAECLVIFHKPKAKTHSMASMIEPPT